MTIAPMRPLPTTALREAAPVKEGVADGTVTASVELGDAMLVSRVVDGASVVNGASVVLGAAVVDSTVEVGSSSSSVEVVVGSGALDVVDMANVVDVVGAVEIWETSMVVVDFAEVSVGSEVAPPSPPSPPAMVKGLEYWNCSGLESSWSRMP